MTGVIDTVTADALNANPSTASSTAPRTVPAAG
jgi:hypothetical protein